MSTLAHSFNFDDSMNAAKTAFAAGNHEQTLTFLRQLAENVNLTWEQVGAAQGLACALLAAANTDRDVHSFISPTSPYLIVAKRLTENMGNKARNQVPKNFAALDNSPRPVPALV